MAKYKIVGEVAMLVYREVDAESEEEARQIWDDWSGEPDDDWQMCDPEYSLFSIEEQCEHDFEPYWVTGQSHLICKECGTIEA